MRLERARTTIAAERYSDLWVGVVQFMPGRRIRCDHLHGSEERARQCAEEMRDWIFEPGPTIAEEV